MNSIKLSPKKVLQSFMVLGISAIIIPGFLSNSSGPGTDASGSPVSSFGTQGCRGCHSSGGSFSPLSGINVSGLPSSYYPGSTYSLTLSLNAPSTTNGFQLASLTSTNTQAGSWITGAGTKTISQGGRTYIEHNSISSTGSWSFSWTAPSTNTGVVNFYSSANAANGNGGTGGDDIYTYTASITGVNLITTTEVITNASCQTASDGQIQVTVNGGVPGYTSQWSTGQSFTTSTYAVSNLASGTYTVTITDADGNTENESFTVGADTPFTISGTIVGTECVVANGSIATNVSSNASAPLTYAWSSGASTSGLSQLTAGNYGLTVTDAIGCSVDTVFTVPDLGSGMQASWQLVNASCGSADGSITNISTNANQPLTVLWNNGETTLDISGLAAGAYTVTITDANGCVESFSETILNEDAPSVSIDSKQNNSCFGDATGSIEISTVGGTGNKTVSWSGPNGFTSSDSVITNLESGAYIYTVSDANMCQVVDTINVTQPLSALEIQVDSVAQPQFGVCDGYIEVQVTGDNSANGYQINWTGPTVSNSEVVSNACEGLYTAIATDIEGCLDTLEVNLLGTSDLGESESNGVSIFPNPVQTALGIRILSNAKAKLVIYNLQGVEVLTNEEVYNGQMVNVSRLAPGNYLVQIEMSNGVITKLIFVKE